jgi:excisionase family DNA binding protein
MTEPTQGLWLTRREAAAYVQVSEATIGREVRSGRLRHARVGGRRSLRFRRDWIDDWLSAARPVEEAAATDATAANLAIPRFIRPSRR